jgi:hypothetical protein
VKLWLAVLPLVALAGEYEGRLLNPLASYSKPGTTFRIRLTGPLNTDSGPALPRGTIVHGAVRNTHSVGLGLRRERAGLEVEFERCETPGGARTDCSVQLVAIDNARESVQKPNRITGILAGSHPQSWFSGVWYRPVAGKFNKSTLGLTGAGGVLHSKLLPTAVGAAAVIATRLLLFRMPDPEIELPAGTELVLRIQSTGAANSVSSRTFFDELLIDTLQSGPFETKAQNGEPSADIVNFAFVATAEELTQAFESGGWSPADPLSARAVLRTYKAFTSMTTYARAPVSTLYYRGKPPDLVFQKAFNSLAKRHHIRLWRSAVAGSEVWLGAATHDVAIAINWRAASLTHRIDPAIDRERHKVLNDLRESGCIAAVQDVPRKELAAQSVVTDGALALVSLQPCETIVLPLSMEKRRRNAFFLTARRVVMESRNYITRGNPYYWAYRGIRKTVFRR